MTLVLTVNGPETIWLLADRRLSLKNGTPRDDGCKVMFLETTDGVAILGYTGLGATRRGTQPADWMSGVLRGRNFPLEQSLDVLAEAMKRQFPHHLLQMPGPGTPAHTVLTTAFLGGQPRFYTIDLALAPDQQRFSFRYTRHVVQTSIPGRARTPRLGIGGAGAPYLKKDGKWIRRLLHVVKAHDRRQVSPYAVADHLANLNYKVHLATVDKAVGPSCIVAWRYRKEGVHKGGGGHQFYTGTTRDSSSPVLPTIANGMDIRALVGVIMPQMAEMFDEMQAGEPPRHPDKDEVDAALAHLPDKPDEDLR
jgi:hypothetical protein